MALGLSEGGEQSESRMRSHCQENSTVSFPRTKSIFLYPLLCAVCRVPCAVCCVPSFAGEVHSAIFNKWLDGWIEWMHKELINNRWTRLEGLSNDDLLMKGVITGQLPGIECTIRWICLARPFTWEKRIGREIPILPILVEILLGKKN